MTKNHSATLKKGLRVLEHIKKKPGTTMRDVQVAFNLSKSTAFRLLTTLEDMGYIYKIQTQYYLDPNNFMEKSEKQSIREWTSLNSIYQIAKSLQMSTYLGKVEGTDLVMSQVLHASFTEKAEDEIGNRTGLHQTALGKVILAHYEEVKRVALMKKMQLEPKTENTFQDSQLFSYHLKVIREDGYAFDDEELAIGVRCIAVPVYRNGEVIAALAVAAPPEDITKSNMREIVSKLHQGSKAVTGEIEALDK
ncbi:IclR family transcriptional regulator [Salinicoccus kekensis]|uniref:IclR family transcriptional regulator n=1 Tax=Salinicoccus kekensis TaxID=714307 RepID=A0A285UM53_9STAP|nr:IclR family transcriptional regulator [Salinicoccus kekensis]SOC41706.1 IclR family transcriptional regulator [Salinicoccus kekensis]